MNKIASTTLLLGMSSNMALACSGPGAAEEIQMSIEVGYYSAFGAVLLSVLLIIIHVKLGINRAWFFLYTPILFTIFHPGFWMSATSGDCGILRLTFSLMTTMVILLIFALGVTFQYKQKLNKK